jgi:hypothetical protein
MIIWRTVILGAAFIFTTGLTALAAQSSTKKAMPAGSATTRAMVYQEVGTIRSITSSELVLTHDANGTQEESTFLLNSQTKTDGEIETGAHVSVCYKNQNHERVVTEIKAQGEKS